MKSASVLFVDHTAVMGGAQHSLLDIAEANRDHGAVALLEDGPFADALEARGVRVLRIAGGEAMRRIKKSSALPGFASLVAASRMATALAGLARPFDVLYANSPKSFLVAALAGPWRGSR